MYVPRHFAAPSPAAMRAAIDDHPFAVLVTTVAGSLEATHVPVVADWRGEGLLRFHLAGANPSAAALAADPEILLVFNGPHTYISPDWYDTPGMVPTWNYIAVHAYGRPRTLDDGALVALLESLSATSEKHLPKKPWTPARVPSDSFAALRRAIVGFEMPIARLEGKWKLNQNRSAADRTGVAAALEALGGDDRRAVADQMRRLGE